MRISPLAQADLTEIGTYIAADNPAAALGVLELLEREILRLRFFAHLGKRSTSGPLGIYCRTVGKPTWRSQFRIFDRFNEREIQVVRVLEGHRRLRRGMFGGEG